MENNKVLLGLALTGLVMASGCTTAQEPVEVKVVGECHGMNACKGTGDCGGKGYSCAGKNSCKGKGWLKLSEVDCVAKKGKFKAK